MCVSVYVCFITLRFGLVMKSLELSENSRAILSHLSDKQMHTVSEIAERLSLNRTTVRRILQRMFVLALAEERKEISGKFSYRITRKGLRELQTTGNDCPPVPETGDVIKYLKAMSESLAQMADRLSAYE
jgi:DNA-binding transcriptional ArsR family regulator